MFKKDFPIFQTYPNLVYLDSASTAQKPKVVQDAMSDMMKSKYANIHRGSYDLSEMAEDIFEKSKEKMKDFLHAESRHEIIYTYNATYASNLLTRSLIKSGILQKGDRVLLSLLEHHANIVPWQILVEEYGISIDWIDVTDDGRIDYEDLSRKAPGAKVISITAASNVTGAITDFAKVRDILLRHPEGNEGSRNVGSHPKGMYGVSQAQNDDYQKPLLVVDASQALPHFSMDVERYGIDFLFATGHKVMSDTGIGILYGKKEHLQKMYPALCGGGAINAVSIEGYESAGLPYRYEPGTPHIIGAASLLAALEYIESIGGYEMIEKYENSLVNYALEKIRELPPSIRLIGPRDANLRLGVFSFFFENHHPRDIADGLADVGICVRAGHHCTEPLHNHYGLPATLRMSIYIYNTKEDIDTFFKTITLLCGKN